MIKILQARLQQYMNQKLPDVQAGFRKGRGTKDEIANICWIKTTLGADCGSDNKLLIAKLRLQLKKVGKTTRPFRYDLNQITYDYALEVRNRLKGLDVIDRVPDELWMEVCDIVQETVIKTIPKKKKCKKTK